MLHMLLMFFSAFSDKNDQNHKIATFWTVYSRMDEVKFAEYSF